MEHAAHISIPNKNPRRYLGFLLSRYRMLLGVLYVPRLEAYIELGTGS